MYEFLRGMPMEVMKSRHGLAVAVAYEKGLRGLRKETRSLWRNVMKDTVELWIGRTCSLKKRLRDLNESTRGLVCCRVGR